MNWLRNILGLCPHKWKLISQGDFLEDQFNAKTNCYGPVIVGKVFYYQCQHCDDVKRKVLK